jgi:hypothetical protein
MPDNQKRTQVDSRNGVLVTGNRLAFTQPEHLPPGENLLLPIVRIKMDKKRLEKLELSYKQQLLGAKQELDILMKLPS